MLFFSENAITARCAMFATWIVCQLFSASIVRTYIRLRPDFSGETLARAAANFGLLARQNPPLGDNAAHG